MVLQCCDMEASEQRAHDLLLSMADGVLALLVRVGRSVEHSFYARGESGDSVKCPQR